MLNIARNEGPREKFPVEPKAAPAIKPRLKHIALLGNFPPRRCGIASFTADVYAQLTSADPELRCDVVAMSDGADETRDIAVRHMIRQDEFADYAEVARRLNADGVEMVCVQHEFGIFGGAAGEHLLAFLEVLECPVVATLHTVLEQPNEDQSRVMTALLRRSSRVIVMAERGRDILLKRYHAPADKIVVIPHGAPDCPLTDPNTVKPRFDYMVGRRVMLTFGLLSPNKGIESVIRSLPAVVAERPDTLYVVLGATHPHLVRREGEAYREGLIKLADELGVGANVRFVNTYVGFEELIAFLSAADVYVTPYLNEAQITSGTLSYAVALGKPVVSTPYWHAAELLSDDVGVLVGFNDSPAFSVALLDLLSNDSKREAYRDRAYAKGRETIWARAGARYTQTFETAVHETKKPIERRRASAFNPSLRGVDRLTDNCGIMQHARFNVPDRAHGYCVDDNARALILMQRGRSAGLRGAQSDRLSAIYASFVDHAWNEGHGRFRNFMSYGRVWLEEAGSEDSFGRSLWSLGETAKLAQDVELRDWAISLGGRVVPHVANLHPIRSHAFAILGLAGLPQPEAREQLRRSATILMEALGRERKSGWAWFEPHLSYDNARLPEALIMAGRILRDRSMTEAGVQALTWLTAMQTAPSGVFRPVGNESFGKPYAGPTQFDQQALEAVASVDACWAAFDATGDGVWAEEAQRAYAWYFGKNEMGVRMVTPDGGGCYDGLGRNGINRNQGAESVLSLQLANCAMKSRERGRKSPAAC